MILTLEEAKDFLKVDYDDEDIFIQDLINASEQYLKNATGKTFDSTNQLAKLYCSVLVNEWFKDRGLMQDAKTSDKVRFTLASILRQLEYCEVNEGG
jgi:uncharacterized phage protein (predicted DNA packaging)